MIKLFKEKLDLNLLDFPQNIEIGDQKYEIQISAVPKNSSSVTIKGNTINFRLSSYLSNPEAIKHLNSLLKKIVKKLLTQTKVNNYLGKSFVDFKTVLEKGYFYFANTKYTLNYAKIRGVKLIETQFFINPKLRLESIEKTVISILIEIYLPRIENYVKEINKKTYNYSLGSISLKVLNSKWGHCAKLNDILLNLKLLNAEIEILDYVIIHELSHIKIKNHSKTFWLNVQKYCPNHKQLRQRLKNSAPDLYYIKNE